MPTESNDHTPEVSELAEESQWTHDAQPSGVDQDRTFALLVAMWALGLPLLIGVLIFVGLLTVESDNNGFWVLAAAVLVLVVVTAVTLWNQRGSRRTDSSS